MSNGKSRITAALLALFVGWLGIHKFYLGRGVAGVLYLLTLGGLGILALIDAIMLFSMSDEDFEVKYS